MSVHEDTLQGLNEILDYAKGKLQLKTTVIEAPDEEVQFYNNWVDDLTGIIPGTVDDIKKFKAERLANKHKSIII